jgi:hypothetical protein
LTDIKAALVRERYRATRGDRANSAFEYSMLQILRSRPVISGAIFVLLGLFFAGAGSWLAALGGTWHYAIVGLGLVATTDVCLRPHLRKGSRMKVGHRLNVHRRDLLRFALVTAAATSGTLATGAVAAEQFAGPSKRKSRYQPNSIEVRDFYRVNSYPTR